MSVCLLSSLGLLNQRGKTSGIMDRKIGKNLAVDFDAGLVEPVNKSAIGEAQFAGGRIDALNPKRAEIALLGAAVTVGILSGLFHRLDGNAENILATAEIALRLGDDFLVGLAGYGTAFERGILALLNGRRAYGF